MNLQMERIDAKVYSGHTTRVKAVLIGQSCWVGSDTVLRIMPEFIPPSPLPSLESTIDALGEDGDDDGEWHNTRQEGSGPSECTDLKLNTQHDNPATQSRRMREDEIRHIYQLGAFGKGSMSRSAPEVVRRDTGRFGDLSVAGLLGRKRAMQLLKNESEHRFLRKQVQPCTSSPRANGELISLEPKVVLDKEVSVVSDAASDKPRHDYAQIQSVVRKEEGQVSDENSDIIARTDMKKGNQANDVGEGEPTTISPSTPSPDQKVVEHLQLTLLEAYFLQHDLGELSVSTIDGSFLTDAELWEVYAKSESRALDLYTAYLHLRLNDWIPVSGFKLGCDFVLYSDDAERVHASYLVSVICAASWTDSGSPSSAYSALVRNLRIAESVKKPILLLVVDRTSLSDFESWDPTKIAANSLVSAETFKRWVPVVKK